MADRVGAVTPRASSVILGQRYSKRFWIASNLQMPVCFPPNHPTRSMPHSASDWISQRSKAFDSSGIRRVFELARQLKDPINLSIGQPDFDVPEAVKQACIEAVQQGRNSYSPSQGIEPLQRGIAERVAAEYPGQSRSALITSGTSGGLVLAMLAMVDPGDEVIIFDPYFVMYPPLVKLVGGVPVLVDTYPDFRIDLDRVRQAITPRTKLILLNTPANPTGVTATAAEVEGLARLAAEQNVALLSDEIYSQFCFDEPLVGPARWNPDTIVIDGFSKSHAMTGWRVGFVHGPPSIIETMIKLQQYTFVCAPQPAQWGALAALDLDMAHHASEYREKRDLIFSGLERDFELVKPGGAFYLFPKVPTSSGLTGSQWVEQGISHGLLTIPGKIFSAADTHFRISFAADERTLRRGIEVLRRMAEATGG